MSAPYLLAALAVLIFSHTIAYLGGWWSRKALTQAQENLSDSSPRTPRRLPSPYNTKRY